MEKNDNKKKDQNGEKNGLELTELFMAKAGQGKRGFDRCFHGTIRREKDESGNDIVIGKIKVNDGIIWSQARDQRILGDQLDWMVEAILDLGLHSDPGVFTMAAAQKLFQN